MLSPKPMSILMRVSRGKKSCKIRHRWYEPVLLFAKKEDHRGGQKGGLCSKDTLFYFGKTSIG